MQTVTELMTDLALRIRQAGSDLLLNHSQIKPNRVTRGIIVLGGDHSWEPLSVEGRRLQSKTRDEYDRFEAILRCLLRTQSASVYSQLLQTSTTIAGLLDQQASTYHNSAEEAVKEFKNTLTEQVHLLDGLFDGAEGDHVYVPDTNALIYNPELEAWEFDGSPTFTLLLMPTVLSELDQLKVTGRDSVREKVNRLVRQCMEYRRRGNLNEGVVLRKNHHSLRTIAVEPQFNNSLPWLDPNNNDDRILAGVVEAMRQHPRCPVVLVTRDINLTNKADYAQIPCVQPPEPIVPATT